MTLRDRVDPVRVVAVGSVALVVVAYLTVLGFVVNVTGRPAVLFAAVAGAALVGAAMGRSLRPRYASLLAAAVLVAGASFYIWTLPDDVEVYGALGPLVNDSIALLTGLSILRIVNANVWALAVAPAPTFLATYLAVRRHYVTGAAVAGATLGIFVLTGDAGAPTTLLGVVGVAGAMGFGDLERRGGSIDGADVVAVALALIVVVPLAVSVVPGGSASPVLTGTSDGDGTRTVETSLVDTADQLTIQGSISLSPKVRFRVTADRASYWQVATYDRYTSRGWVRTGGSRQYDEAIAPPPGQSRPLDQRYTMVSAMSSMPAAWKPVSVSGSSLGVRVAGDGTLRAVGSFAEGDSYSVVSRTPSAGPRALRQAGTDYPAGIEERYTQLPERTPERVATRTDRITANADNPYDTARVIEQWLENNRRYSLNVERPEGDIADAFLFEMQAGYCTYFATTMVAMLRTQGVPARLAVGYTPGERVARDQWVVRGLNSHAWVEAYFPGHGWIRFDPTPGGPRQQAEGTTLSQARAQNESGVDTAQTGPEEWTPTPTPTPVGPTPTPGTDDATTRTPRLGQFGTPTPNGSTTAGSYQFTPAGGSGGGLPELPSRERLALFGIVFVGAVASVRRSGLARRAYRALWLRYQPRSDPRTDVERAYERLEYVLSRRERPRHTGETVRRYTAEVGDPDAQRLAELYERAVYAGEVTDTDADEAVSIADDAVQGSGRWP